MDRLHIYEERTGKYVGCFKRYVDNARILLDVGCGPGAFSEALAYGERLVVALDIDREVLRKFEGENIERICADAHHLPLRECSIDCVLSHLLSTLKIPRVTLESFTEF